MLPSVAPIAALAASLTLALSLPPDLTPPPPPATVPALEIIKAYGSLAGRECYGRTSPPESSCRLPLDYLEGELGIGPVGGTTTGPSSSSLTSEDFSRRLSDLPFRWPLKPYGLSDESYGKTAVVNKGAETATYMYELESRGLYDRRNPAGPLPTSLRPRLNDILNREGIDPVAAEVVFRALSGGRDLLTDEALRETFGEGRESLDYYGFVGLVGESRISWPRYGR